MQAKAWAQRWCVLGEGASPPGRPSLHVMTAILHALKHLRLRSWFQSVIVQTRDLFPTRLSSDPLCLVLGQEK